MGNRINLTDDQLEALAEHLGVNASDVAGALYAANRELGAADDKIAPEAPATQEPEATTPATQEPAKPATFDANAWVRGKAHRR